MHWHDDPCQRVETIQNQAMNELQHHQHAETAEHLQTSQQGEPVQPAETDRLGSNQGRAGIDDGRPEQPGPSVQIQPANSSDEEYVWMDEVDLATAVQIAQQDFKLDFLAAMAHQAWIMQGIHDRRLMQGREQGYTGGGVDLGPANVVASAADVVQIGQDPLAIRVARGPFGIVRTRTFDGVVVTELPLRPPNERAMRDAVGRLILDRPA
ncbi:hypothetical protein AYL99_02519 [Fonsecaea erecta]|uniref:Uncharacterized protein n=1 Tax=Fonsecaea erecta TaxID=1367422 RepID=A0A178ZU78_9EURO|nr:hypothetical protein AYL99_02519 [Fonsecaea erecta]OAP63292.1 hypothetical protein AYL99_02519 [Fonsecaea erecta]